MSSCYCLNYNNSSGVMDLTPLAVARIRKAVISHLPPRCTAKFVASLVYGGQIESIIIKPSLAEVLFVNAQDCTQFCTDNENGLDYGKDKNEFVLVDMNKDVDVVGGKLQEMIDTGATRCVRVIGVDHGWTKERLWDLAEKRNSKLEHLEDQMNEETKVDLSSACRLNNVGC